jgi:flagellar biosynthesis anti-sigma factor FlgM
MRISNEQIQQILAAKKVKGTGSLGPIDSIGGVKSSDNLNVSNNSNDIQRFLPAVASISDVRLDKVNQLKLSIENGTYDVSAQDIARSILSRSADRLI